MGKQTGEIEKEWKVRQLIIDRIMELRPAARYTKVEGNSTPHGDPPPHLEGLNDQELVKEFEKVILEYCEG